LSWIVSGIVLSVFAAVFEKRYGDRFFVNTGAHAVSAVIKNFIYELINIFINLIVN